MSLFEKMFSRQNQEDVKAAEKENVEQTEKPLNRLEKIEKNLDRLSEILKGELSPDDMEIINSVKPRLEAYASYLREQGARARQNIKDLSDRDLPVNVKHDSHLPIYYKIDETGGAIFEKDSHFMRYWFRDQEERIDAEAMDRDDECETIDYSLSKFGETSMLQKLGVIDQYQQASDFPKIIYEEAKKKIPNDYLPYQSGQMISTWQSLPTKISGIEIAIKQEKIFDNEGNSHDAKSLAFVLDPEIERDLMAGRI